MTPIDIEKLREIAALKPLYVGAQNDGLFIIDEPPRPVPTDHVNESLTTQAVGKIYDDFRNMGPAIELALSQAPTLAAAVIDLTAENARLKAQVISAERIAQDIAGGIIEEETNRRHSAERRIAALESALKALDAHLDFGTPYVDGELAVFEDASGINAAFEQARLALAGTPQAEEG